MGKCRTCESVKGHSWAMVFCLRFGIFIRGDYCGCRYHREREENDQTDERTVCQDVRQKEVS